jgi:hypothetical protein
VFDDLAAYFHENVVSSYVAYVDVRNNKPFGISKDLRSAITAATALFHLREHVPAPYKKSRSAIAKVCPDYNILGDVVNASKHRKLDRGKPQVKTAEDVFETTVTTEYEDENGPYFDTRKLVMVRLNDGSEHDLMDALTNVINYWGNELTQNGILKSFEPFPLPPHPGERFLSRTEAKAQQDLEAIQGVRFRLNFKLLKFDQALGQAEPIDLAGSELRFRIYEPSLNVQLEHSVSGKKYSFTLKLNKDEAMEWHSLKTDEERQRFTIRFGNERRDELQRLLIEALKAEREGHGSSTGGPSDK